MPAAPIAIASLAIGAIGAGVSAMGAVEQGQASQEMANYQAQVAQVNQTVAQQNAQQATAAGAVTTEISQLKTAGTVGALMAEQSTSGIDVGSGSPVQARLGQQLSGAMDALTVQNNAAREAYGYLSQATGYQAQAGLETATGEQAQTAAMLGAGSSILSGASSIGSNYLKFLQTGALGGDSTIALGGLY